MPFTLLPNSPHVNTINFMPAKNSPITRSNAYHHGNLRDALLHAALLAMAASGDSQFSLSELARTVGVTPAAAYKHFLDKNALLDALAQHGFARLRGRFEQAAPLSQPARDAKQAIQRFERIGHAYLQFGLNEPALFHLVFGKGASGYRQRAATGDQSVSTFSYLAKALDDLFHFGLIARPPTAQDQWFAWSAIHGATELAIAQVSSLVGDRQAARLIASRVIAALAAA